MKLFITGVVGLLASSIACGNDFECPPFDSYESCESYSYSEYQRCREENGEILRSSEIDMAPLRYQAFQSYNFYCWQWYQENHSSCKRYCRAPIRYIDRDF